MNRHLHVNPYIAGSPVTGTEMFFGRDDVFTFIRRNLIGRHRDTPVVLYGQRRTGKTSVLYQLHRHLDPSYRCIFIDLHGLSLDSMGSLLHGIASSISRDLRREHHLTVPVPDRSLFLAEPRSAFQTRFLDAALSALGDDHLVLMLDEVVRLYEEVEHGRLEREIFDFLRHLMQHYERLNFIFSLGSGLEEMAREYAFLFSVSLYHRISFLEPAAARSLITEPAREHYQVAPQAVMKILEITSGHPYYTQLVCHCLFDSWSRSPKSVMDVPDVEAILAEAIELGSPNLTYVWEDSTPEEQALMAGIAATGGHDAGAVTIDQVRETWHKAGLTLPEREITRAARSLISRDVLAGDQAYSFNVDPAMEPVRSTLARRNDPRPGDRDKTANQTPCSRHRSHRGGPSQLLCCHCSHPHIPLLLQSRERPAGRPYTDFYPDLAPDPGRRRHPPTAVAAGRYQ